MGLGEMYLDEHERKLGENSVLNAKYEGNRKEPGCPVCGEQSTTKIDGQHRYACGYRSDWDGVKSPCTRRPCKCKLGTLLTYGCVCNE